MRGSRFQELLTVNSASVGSKKSRRTFYDRAIPASLNFVKAAPKPTATSNKSRSSSNKAGPRQRQQQQPESRRSSDLVTHQEKNAYSQQHRRGTAAGERMSERTAAALSVDELEAALEDILADYED
ncbi:expressed unknown protein [Seminavis robusta]|uniref:Uncharacterized protein n=1 Tax=Seminavis robusta TaxID=568900 RepID=A0A9N8E2P2_9STRA|nr:expressed unknown protein [Seminavis robusta]|eukprot:Sro593_g172350.1 n/a (126) ;mRNA; f:50905-51282